MSDHPIRVSALYRFARFAEPQVLRDSLHAIAHANGVHGTVLLAREGINGTIAGTPGAIDAVLAHIRTFPGCADLAVRDAAAATIPFHRLKVRVKREIVTMGVAVDPLTDAGAYVAPGDWNALIADPRTILIDTRNDYEVRIGSFAGAIDPQTTRFADFPDWFAENKTTMAGAKVAMFCTGGIRCEKATAFVRAQGIDEVFHLEGGILKYLETVPAEDSRWDGECFVFDERVAVRHGLEAGSHVLCRGCRMPVGPADRESPLYIEGVGCPACHDTRDDVQRAGYAERHRQARLAAARGVAHVGRTNR